jgi:hypothetical protein
MFYYYNALQTKSGDILPDYLVRLLDASGNEVEIFADNSGTPIVSVSGVANAAKADDLGMVRFWVPNGTYDIAIYDTTDTFKGREEGVPMYDAGSLTLDLSGTEGATLVGTPTGTVQDDIDAANAGLAARPTTAALASSTGGAMVGLDDGRDLQGYVDNIGLFNAAITGVSASATATANTVALQAALDHVAATGGLGLQLPPGELSFDDDVIIPTHDNDLSGSTAFSQIAVKGMGSGENGTFLNFSHGSLRVRSTNFHLADFRVTSADSDGIIYEPMGSDPERYAVRGITERVRSENCAGSGFVYTDAWENLMIGCFARYNGGWGIEGRDGPDFAIGCNALTIIGGQYQGNGTIGGTPVGSGGSDKSTGGGIYTGAGNHWNLYGNTIEGNVGDGLVFGERLRGCLIDGVYFEKNGRNPLDRDIRNAAPGVATDGPNSIIIRNSNFTPQDYNGTIGERAIDLYDVHDLRIVNPQFFTSGGNGFSQPPIRIRETTANRACGWVEGRYYTSTGAYPTLLTNETARFGFPRKHVFSPNFEMTKGAGDTTWGPVFIHMPGHCGRRVDANYISRAAAGSGTARIVRNLARGPAGTLFSAAATDVAYAGAVNSVYTTTNSSHNSLPGTHVEVSITRDEDHANDTLAASLRLQSVEITTYEGVISAYEIW